MRIVIASRATILGSVVVELPPESVLVADVEAFIDGECVDYDYRCFPIHHLD
jgi:hypothetical protein